MKGLRARARRLAALAGLAFGLALTGCIFAGGDSFFLSGGGGGGEDFPNTAQPLSKELAKEAASSTDWGRAASVQLPDLPDLNVFEDLRIEPIDLSKTLGKASGAGLAKPGLGKRAAEGDCDTAFYAYDPLEIQLYRRGRKIVCEEGPDRVRRDTLQFYLWTLPPDSVLSDTALALKYVRDSAVLINAWGRVTYAGGSKFQTYRAWNDDSLGTLDRAEYVTTTLETVARTVQRVRAYGRDGAYQREDAPPAYYELLKTVGLDTLDWRRMSDADGDSAFWARDAKEGAKGLVNYERRAKDPSDAPEAASLSLTMRAMLHHVPGGDDSLATRWYFERRGLRSGAVTSFSFRGVAADSALLPNDTALVTLDTVFAPGDSMVAYRADYRLLLGPDPADAAARSLTRLEVEKTWRRGPLRASRTELRPSSPTLPGRPFVGAMSAQTRNKDGDTVYTDGTVDADGMVLMLRVLSKGTLKVYRLVLDLQGNEKEPMREIPVNAEGNPSTRADTGRQVAPTTDTAGQGIRGGARSP